MGGGAVFKIFGQLALDKSQFDKGLGDAEHEASSFANKLKTGLGKGLAVAGKATVAAVGAAATAVGVLTKKSVDAYAEYEQLAGGVKKLYGNMGQSLEEYAKDQGKSVDEVKDEWQSLEDAQNEVLNNAKQAYKTAGMDMNTYLDTATTFSASLINSLGGDTMEAAKQTDKAMRAISDNYNTFGGDMEGISNAFKGFSKQNYTMLDNLKLGYGGTKQEMERLIKDANEWGKANGQASDLTIDSFSDIVTAIDQIQQKQNIAGTTAREATTTIQGSLGMLKGAWQNLLMGFSDSEADIDQLINNVVEAIVGGTDETGKHINGFLDNIIPTIRTALTSIGIGIMKIAPVIVDQLPALINELLPPLITAATTLVGGLVTSLPSILTVLIQQIPMIITTLTQAIVNTGPAFISAGKELIEYLSNGLGSVDVGAKLLELLDKGLNFIDKNLGKWLDKGVELMANLGTGFIKSIPRVIEFVGKVFIKLFAFILKQAPKLLVSGTELIVKLATGFIKAIPQIINAATKVVAGLINTLIQNLPKLIETGFKMIGKLVAGIIRALPDIIKAMLSLSTAMVKTLSQVDWKSLGINVVKGIINGLKAVGSELITAMLDLAKGAFTAVKKFFGIQSPSKVMRDQVGKMLGLGMAEGIKESSKTASKEAEKASKAVLDAAKKTLEEKKAANQITLAGEVDFWANIVKQTKKGTAAYREASVKLGKAITSAGKQMDKLISDYRKDLKAVRKDYKKQADELTKDLKKQKKEINENLKATVKALEDTYSETVSNRKKDILGQLGLFSEFKADDVVNKNDLQNNLKSQVNALKRWDSTLDKLQERLGGSSLLEELQAMGVSSLGTLEELNKMSDAELDAYVQLYDEKNRLAEERAVQESETLRNETDQQIEDAKADAQTKLDKLDENYAKSMSKLKTKLSKENAKLKKSLNKDFKDIGIDMAKGMDKGLSSAMKAVRKNILKEVKDIVKDIRSAYKIKSPSRVFADQIGRMLPLGIEQGFKEAMPEATRGIIKSLDDMNNDIYDDGMWEPVDGLYGSDSTVSAATNITMNIYGAEGQNINELANLISRKLGNEVRRTQVVWA